MNRKSVIFATTKTSASGSIVRILKKIASHEYTVVGFGSELDAVGGVSRSKIPKENFIVLHNQTKNLKDIPEFEDYKYLINFRDPRDRMCNSFYWMQQHPQPGDTQGSLRQRAEKIKYQGIDDWVINNTNIGHEHQLMSFVDSLPEKSYCISTYAGLCLDFDRFIQKIADFIGVELTEEHWRNLENERIESLDQNKQYIGNKWKGSDVMPGRFKNELSEATIKNLNTSYFSILRSMAKYDADFARLYLEGLPEKIPFIDLPKKLAPNFDGADVLREVALDFEHSGDIETALKIMQKALELRPTGPFIKKRVIKYQAVIESTNQKVK